MQTGGDDNSTNDYAAASSTEDKFAALERKVREAYARLRKEAEAEKHPERRAHLLSKANGLSLVLDWIDERWDALQ